MSESFQALVTNGLDDGFITNGPAFFDSTVEMMHGALGGYVRDLWIRWDNCTIPRGAEIVTASIRAYVWTASTYDTGKIYFNLVGDAVAPTSYADYVGKSVTTAYTNWLVSGSAWQNSPNCKTPLQEVINHNNWASGNAIMAMIYHTAVTTNVTRFYTYDQSSSYRAELNITYIPVGGSPVSITPVLMF